MKVKSVKLYDAAATTADETAATSSSPHDVAATAALVDVDLPAAKHDPGDTIATNSSIAYESATIKGKSATIKGNDPKTCEHQQPATRSSSQHAAAHHAVMCAIKGKQEDQPIWSSCRANSMLRESNKYGKQDLPCSSSLTQFERGKHKRKDWKRHAVYKYSCNNSD
jgi:hypothetical protein